MQIEIPPESESFVRSKAKAAGFDNVRDYVLNLILEDDARQFDVARSEQLAVEDVKGEHSG